MSLLRDDQFTAEVFTSSSMRDEVFFNARKLEGSVADAKEMSDDNYRDLTDFVLGNQPNFAVTFTVGLGSSLHDEGARLFAEEIQNCRLPGVAISRVIVPHDEIGESMTITYGAELA